MAVRLIDQKAMRRESFLLRCIDDSASALRAAEDKIIQCLHELSISDGLIADILELIYQASVEDEALEHKWQCLNCGATHNEPDKPCVACGGFQYGKETGYKSNTARGVSATV